MTRYILVILLIILASIIHPVSSGVWFNRVAKLDKDPSGDDLYYYLNNIIGPDAIMPESYTLEIYVKLGNDSTVHYDTRFIGEAIVTASMEIVLATYDDYEMITNVVIHFENTSYAKVINSTTSKTVRIDYRCVYIKFVKQDMAMKVYIDNKLILTENDWTGYYDDLTFRVVGVDYYMFVDLVTLQYSDKLWIDYLNDFSKATDVNGAEIVRDPYPLSCSYPYCFGGSTEMRPVFPLLLLILSISVIPLLLFHREGLPGFLLGLFMLARIGYSFLNVVIVVFTVFVITRMLKNSLGQEVGLLTGLFMAYMINALIILGEAESVGNYPGNVLELPGWFNNVVTRAVTFDYIAYPFNYILSLLFAGLLVFAVVRLLIRVIRGV